MRSVVITEFGGHDKIQVIESPIPQPGSGEVLVRVTAAALHPTDTMQIAGLYVEFGAAAVKPQVGIGVDMAGVVEAVGDGVTTVAVGDEVIGIQERLDQASSAQADFVVLEEWAVAPSPAGVPAAEAAGLPLNGLTAWQALEVMDLPAGAWLLVTGAAGAVGTIAVQLAKIRGLRVMAHGRSGDEALLEALGADSFISSELPLSAAAHEAVPGGVAGVLDAANLGIAAHDALAHGGKFVSLLNGAPQARRDTETHNLAYHTDRAQLGLLSSLAAAGVLKVAVAETFPLAHAKAAHARLTSGGQRGLVVLLT